MTGDRREVRVLYGVTHAQSLRLLSMEYLAHIAPRLEVHVCSGALDAETAEAVAALGVATVSDVGYRRQIAPVADAVAFVRSWWLIRRLRPDVVHANTPKASLCLVLAALLLRVPVRVVTVHGAPWETREGPLRRLLIAVERLVMASATEIHFVSPSLRSLYRRHGIVAADAGRVLLNGSWMGVDSSRFRPPSDRRAVRAELDLAPDATVVGFLGRLSGDKGVEHLAQAWATIARACPSAVLLLGGPLDDSDPPPAHALEALSTSPRVRAVGFVSDTPRFLQTVDVMVLPSLREGYSKVILEAAATGIPAVAFKVTGVRDAIVHGRTGLLVASGDSEALAAAVVRLADDADLRHELGRAARARAIADFDPEAIARATASLYGSPPPSEGTRAD